jgi:2-polyprenyl-3-methyl-5-hydroxy-6-metoxy-1,4-benzoquinol methylase
VQLSVVKVSGGLNYKLLLPTYRARQRWVMRTLDRVGRTAEIGRMINVGCGEGDIDCNFRQSSGDLVACDLNEGDVAHARALNADVAGIGYLVSDAQQLPFDDESFDVVCCLEVIEHVAEPRACLRELARIVRTGGHVVLTCPSARFPPTYDPLNWVLSRVGTHVGIGAFGYGHDWLVREEELVDWARGAGLRLVDSAHLCKALAGLAEAYWPGFIQSAIKANAKNRRGATRWPVEAAGERARVVPVARPSRDNPPLLGVVDAFIDADSRLFSSSRASLDLGFLFQRLHRD